MAHVCVVVTLGERFLVCKTFSQDLCGAVLADIPKTKIETLTNDVLFKVNGSLSLGLLTLPPVAFTISSRAVGEECLNSYVSHMHSKRLVDQKRLIRVLSLSTAICKSGVCASRLLLR